MSEKREVADKEKSAATLRELRQILANTPEAAKIFYGEVDRRWGRIPLDQRRWVCKMAGAPGVEETPYTKIDKAQRAKIRIFVSKMRILVDMLEFAIKQG